MNRLNVIITDSDSPAIEGTALFDHMLCKLHEHLYNFGVVSKIELGPQKFKAFMNAVDYSKPLSFYGYPVVMGARE